MASLGPPEDGQIAGLTQQLAALPAGVIQPGMFTVTAKGGSDVGPFQSSAQIGPGVRIATALPPGTTLHRTAPLVVNWTPGESATWVTIKLMAHLGSYDQYGLTQVPASAGAGTITPDLLASIPAGAVELEIDVEPENPAAFTAPRLSLGGEHTWRVIYRFTGLLLD
jgi:hypothetical protein